MTERMARAQAQLAMLAAEAEADQPDLAAQERVAALTRELEALERDREAELTRQLAELEQQLAATVELEASRTAAVDAAKLRVRPPRPL